MKNALKIRSFYFKNYHCFVLFNSIIFLILSIPFPTVDDWSLNGMRYLLDYPIMLFLTLLVVLNIALYSRSFVSKSYPNIQDGMSDIFNVYCVYIAIILKIMLQLLFFSYYINENNMIIISSAKWMLGTMALFYFLSLLSIGHFVFHSVKGTYKRYKTPAIQPHWINDYLNPKQLRKLKNISSKGKVVSVYFSGFLLSEADNSVVIRQYKLKLNAFRDYITLNNLKLDDLNDDELKVIEMLGI